MNPTPLHFRAPAGGGGTQPRCCWQAGCGTAAPQPPQLPPLTTVSGRPAPAREVCLGGTFGHRRHPDGAEILLAIIWLGRSGRSVTMSSPRMTTPLVRDVPTSAPKDRVARAAGGLATFPSAMSAGPALGDESRRRVLSAPAANARARRAACSPMPRAPCRPSSIPRGDPEDFSGRAGGLDLDQLAETATGEGGSFIARSAATRSVENVETNR